MLDSLLTSHLPRLNEEDAIEAIRILTKRIHELHNPEYHLLLPVKDLPFSPKAYNILIKERLYTVRDIIEYGFENLWFIRGVGPKTLNEIRQLIEKIIENKKLIRGLSGLELKDALMKKK